MKKFAVCFAASLAVFFSSCKKAAMPVTNIQDISFGYAAELDNYINSIMSSYHIAGISACIVQNGKIRWAEGFGYAKINPVLKPSPDILFMMASVSKTVTATALMTLYDKGLFHLDDNINQYLPFKVTDPNFPHDTITFRMLLTHTSGIKDNGSVLNNVYVYNHDSPISLHNFLYSYLIPGGSNYNVKKNFGTYKPGIHYEYSNVGAVLIGYLTEVISGKPFDKYCNEKIFQPLAMQSTSWKLAGLDTNQIAMPYSWRNNEFKPDGYYCYPDYPDGQLRTTTADLAKFEMMLMNKGSFNGTEILKPSTVNEMTRVQFPAVEKTQGLILYYKKEDGRLLIGHNGGDSGVSTEMFWDPAANTGIIIQQNSNAYNANILIEKKMFELAEQ